MEQKLEVFKFSLKIKSEICIWFFYNEGYLCIVHLDILLEWNKTNIERKSIVIRSEGLKKKITNKSIKKKSLHNVDILEKFLNDQALTGLNK